MAVRLRDGQTLDAAGQQRLADLVEELNALLRRGPVPADERARLAESITGLLESLHGPGPLEAIEDRLEQAAVMAEAEAPTAVGLARQLIATLANLGI